MIFEKISWWFLGRVIDEVIFFYFIGKKHSFGSCLLRWLPLKSTRVQPCLAKNTIFSIFFWFLLPNGLGALYFEGHRRLELIEGTNMGEGKERNQGKIMNKKLFGWLRKVSKFFMAVIQLVKFRRNFFSTFRSNLEIDF